MNDDLDDNGLSAAYEKGAELSDDANLSFGTSATLGEMIPDIIRAYLKAANALPLPPLRDKAE